MKLFLVFSICLLLHHTKGQLDSDDYENCMFLGNNQLKIAWTVDPLKQQINFLLCECQQSSQVSSINQYMGFGLSGSATRTLMIGADATIVWVDDNDGPQAVDYYLSAYVQCRGGFGACPDSLDSSRRCSNDVDNSTVSGFKRNGVQCVAYSKKFQTGDTTCDRNIDPDNENQYIVWAVGSLGETAFRHFLRADASDPPIHFGRTPDNQCRGGTGALTCSKCDPFEEKVLDVRGENATIVANIGPTGNERGYEAIADQAGWGIAWYLNGTLIPRVIVQRNRKYTFLSEGGSDPTQFGFYHPFYITSSKSGGRLLNDEAQRGSEVVYAGFDKDDNPLGTGPYCEYVESENAALVLNNCGSFQEYLNNVVKSPCQTDDAPRSFTWTPDNNTPDTVYYQCATHLNLGFEITVEPPLSTIVATPTDKPDEPTCPTGMVFDSCGTACPLTCDNFRDAPLICTRQCVIGCFCPQGKVLDNNEVCVDPSSCPSPITTTTLPSPVCAISETLEVGQLPNLAHGISGSLQIISSNQLLIKNFNYDGRGPDTFIYYFPPGVSANRRGNGGEIIPFSEIRQMFPFGQRYTNQDFVINLPDGLTACDIGTFTIWCRRFRQFFTTLEIPQDIFTAPTTATAETTKPPPPSCPTGMVFDSCGTACPLTCDNFRDAPLPCTKQCVIGCFCPQGKVLDNNEVCVDPSSCPAPTTSQPTEETTKPPKPTCPTGMVFNSCGTACPLTCENFRNTSLACTNQCVSGCFCPRGRVLNNGVCVDPNRCPVPTPRNIQAFCSVVVWDYPYLDDLVEYDIRLIDSSSEGTRRKFRTQLPSRPFYVLHESDQQDATASTLFQIRGRTSTRVGRWSTPVSLGCMETTETPTCPPCECNTEAPAPQEPIRPGLYLKGRYIHNNSEVQLSDVGEGEDALLCLTDNEDCCEKHPDRNGPRGQFYYPSNARVPFNNPSHAFYRNRGHQLIRLNRRGDTVIMGSYCCEIPDADMVLRKLCVNLV